jgi:hypothetical protein
MARQVSRQELYDLVWSTPMRTLAAQFGISDVGLKKTCARAMIPTPDRGYWAKKEAGKQTSRVALPLRAPGMIDEVVVARGHHYWRLEVTEKELLELVPAAPEFPEPLEAVRERIAAVVGRVSAPHKVTRWHPLIEQLLAEDERRRQQQRVTAYRIWEQPLYDSPLERRRLRILNALFFAVPRMNGKPSISNHEPRSPRVSFYAQHVGITLEPPVQPRRAHTNQRVASDTTLVLSILQSSWSKDRRRTWQDEESGKLEAQLTEIAIDLVLTAERQYREGALHRHEWRVRRKAELEEKERQQQIEAERAERARQRRIEQVRIDRLLRDAAAFHQANQIRHYVEALRSVHASNALASSQEFDGWSAWALAQADRIDPAKNETFFSAAQDEKEP